MHINENLGTFLAMLDFFPLKKVQNMDQDSRQRSYGSVSYNHRIRNYGNDVLDLIKVVKLQSRSGKASPFNCALVLVFGALALVLTRSVVGVDGDGECHVHQRRHQL